MMEILNNNIPKKYKSFFEKENFSEVKASDYITEIQEIYLSDKRPWVIGFSGGKDSTAVLILVYVSLLGLPSEKRHKPVFVVASDTLVETPVVVDHINNALDAVQEGALRDNLPITTHKVIPETNETFWVNLLGKGYPAPTRQFRWCTERLKIDPVSDFIKQQVAEYDEVIVVLGSRSQESQSRAQVIARHKISGTRLARHTSLSNAFIYTPIDTWSVDDVWKIIRDLDEYDAPWGASNYGLWLLYLGSSQGECPMVIDESTPSCGNSRFGCWTCTVVTKDRAMESLIESGDDWMEPLLKFRNMLANTGIVENKNTFRNYKRRIGKVSYKWATKGQDISEERGHIPGPYWLKYRKEWLKELLEIEKDLNSKGHKIELITKPELHAIRKEWLTDPNEPDWEDSLPTIYRSVYNTDLNWVYDDNVNFDKHDAEILKELGSQYGVDAEMIMKLIEVENSMSGLSQRRGIFAKLESILKQDWGSYEQIIQKHSKHQSKRDFDIHAEQIKKLDEAVSQLDKLDREYH
ncbi:DNA phosphorothioation system sulfurtransferase DndC [Methylophaga pinxianii]|uniref:DNA phosphorothioation system sulfurtransferase DndC n=1 Tax=Methylophaga pinxianii TaxID=2881052 RepID=UPI001CF3CDDA|nr:DNA phosphorothioation system sulfurtransferase DndC [Methylophaga pinxianii]MCB2426043.1 DNA phosphorothioation system sulfurtransferase DndC [Methylophaga pinxianii]UPH46152.1 DNA phosphorothioation system sulfurtransferase DndC [Methylophaga pinxianii]